MRIERRFTVEDQSPYAEIAFRTTTSEIKNPDGSIVFQSRDIEVPAEWSQVACDVLAQKYFRKAGVPARLKRVREGDIPEWLCRHIPDAEPLLRHPPTGEHRYQRAFSLPGRLGGVIGPRHCGFAERAKQDVGEDVRVLLSDEAGVHRARQGLLEQTKL